MKVFKPIGSHKVTQIIGELISERILSNEISPGDKLSTEKELASQFNVSIATVRDSLKRLEALGLIEKKLGKGGGIFVTTVKSEPIKLVMGNFLKRQDLLANHLDQVRLALEPPMVRIAASQRTLGELEMLETNIIYCEERLLKTSKKLTKKEQLTIGDKNIEFHKVIGISTHNPIFAVTIDYVMDLEKEYNRIISGPNMKVFIQVIKDHRNIFYSIKESDENLAEKYMRSHLNFLEDFNQSEGV